MIVRVPGTWLEKKHTIHVTHGNRLKGIIRGLKKLVDLGREEVLLRKGLMANMNNINHMCDQRQNMNFYKSKGGVTNKGKVVLWKRSYLRKTSEVYKVSRLIKKILKKWNDQPRCKIRCLNILLRIVNYPMRIMSLKGRLMFKLEVLPILNNLQWFKWKS